MLWPPYKICKKKIINQPKNKDRGTGPRLPSTQRLKAFEDGGNALAETNAHGCNPEVAAILLHHIEQSAGDSRAGATERVAQGDRAAVQVNLLVHLVEYFQIFQHRQGLCGEGFVELEEVDICDGQARALQGFLCRRYRTIAHDRRVHTRYGHRTNHRHRLDTQVLGTLRRHHDHARGTVGDLRRSAGCHSAALWIDRRFQGGQAFQGGIRTNGFVVVEQFQETVLVVAVHRDDFILELAFHGRLVGELVGTQAERILGFAGNAVHLAEHFRGEAHHARGFCRVQRHVRVGIDTVHHADVAHVLHATDHEYITVAGHDRLGSRVQCAHRRTTQAADRLGGRGVRDLGQQGGHAGDVPALFQGLVDTAPDHVFDFVRIDLDVTLQQFADQVRRHVFGAGVAVHAALGAAHRRATEVDNHDVSWIQAHKYSRSSGWDA